MKGQRQVLPTTSLGTSDSSVLEKVSGIAPMTDGMHPLQRLREDMYVAKMQGPEEGFPMPVVETTPEVIHYYNKGRLDSVTGCGYFILEDVMICETGTKEELKKKLDITMDEKIFGKKL